MMESNDIQACVDNLVAEKSQRTKPAPPQLPKKPFRPFGAVSEKALMTAAAVLFVLAAGVSWWQAHPNFLQASPPRPVQTSDVSEIYDEKELSWFVVGVMKNVTDAPVDRARVCVSYKNASGAVVAVVVAEAKDLKPFESYRFRIPCAMFSADLRREIVSN